MDTQTRRSREKRQPTGKILELTDFDKKLLRLIQEYPTIDTNHIFRLMPEYSRDWIYRRLREHFHEIIDESDDDEEDLVRYLRRCPEQYKHGNKNYRSIMYEVTAHGAAYADEELGPLVHHRRSHSFLHQALEMRTVASLRIACEESELHSFLPPERLLTLAPETTRKRPQPFVIPLKDGSVAMDWRGPFAISYKGKSMCVALEADNKTERVQTTNVSVRSFEKVFREWGEVYRDELHTTELGLSSFMVAIVCPSKVRIQRAMALLERMHKEEGITTKPFLFKYVTRFKDYWTSPKPAPELLYEPWSRVGYPDFYLSTLSERKLDQQATSLNNN